MEVVGLRQSVDGACIWLLLQPTYHPNIRSKIEKSQGLLGRCVRTVVKCILVMMQPRQHLFLAQYRQPAWALFGTKDARPSPDHVPSACYTAHWL